MTFMNASPITVDDFIVDLERRGVTLRLDAAGELEVVAPVGTLSERDKRLLTVLKRAIVTALRPRAPTPVHRADGAATATVTATEAMADGQGDGRCGVPGCPDELFQYDAHGRAYCATHAPEPEPEPDSPAAEGVTGRGSWHCLACHADIDAALACCPRCLRRPDGAPSPCSVAGCPRPAVRDREHAGGAGPALEPFCPAHRRGAEVLHVAAARNWPACTLRDGTTINAGKAAWLRAVREHGDERWYLRVLSELGSTVPPRDRARSVGGGAPPDASGKGDLVMTKEALA
jgi:hypothetical protein